MERRRDGLERRHALLDAALRCFSRSGVLGVGIEEVRREAGASSSSVYNLFTDLNELTLALLLRTFERLFRHLVERALRTRTAEALVVTIVDAHLEWVLGNPGEGRFMYQATALEFTPQASAELLRRKAELLAPIAAHIAPFVQRRALPNWSVLQFDVVLLGVSHEACRRFLAGAPLDANWMRSTLPGLAWRSIAAAVSAARRRGESATRPMSAASARTTMKAQAPIESIDTYIQQFRPEVQALLRTLRKAIKGRARGATEKIAYGIPTFYLNGNLVHFAAFAKHIGFYPTPSAMAAFERELTKYKRAKGSVQFPIDEPLPLDLIARMVDFRVSECATRGTPPMPRTGEPIRGPESVETPSRARRGPRGA